MRFVDCGAFNGDTVEALAHAGFQFDAIAAFEPDPDNYAALASRARRHGPAFCFPCGVASSTRMVRFDAGSGMGSREAPDGNTAIQCVALDDAIAGFRPTLLKMDIEGAELDALGRRPQRRLPQRARRWQFRSITSPSTYGRFRC